MILNNKTEYIAFSLSAEGRHNNPYPAAFMYILMILGLIQITVFVCKLLSFIYRHTLKCRKNFKQRYNQGDSWAVVTGGSDGIGE